MAQTKSKRDCPRESFLERTLSSGQTKDLSLRAIMEHVVIKLDPLTATLPIISSLVADEFAAQPKLCMFPFEAESEEKRMTTLISRWATFEAQQPTPGKTLAKDFTSTITFAGNEETKSVHLLVDRGTGIEAIQFKYKAPEYRIRGKSPATRPDGSAELLMIQRAGEAKVKELAVKKPGLKGKLVYGCIYYLKHKEDTSNALALTFEDKAGNNIVSHHFTQADSDIVTAAYVAPDVNVTCDVALCRDCLYYDLCHSTFEKRKLMEQPPVVLKTIDEIKLTDAQFAFVSFEQGVCRVNAVAGSGKTTVVALRTLALIEKGAKGESILMVTFSAKGTEEMAIRLKSFVHGKMMAGADVDISKVQIQTFNSWGQHVLDENFALLGFSARPTLVDDIAKKDIILSILDAHRTLPLDYRNPFMSTKSAEGAVVKLVKFIDTLKAGHAETEKDIPELLGPKMLPHAAELLQIYKDYNAQLMACNSIDYEDQLRLLLKLADFGIFEQMPYEHIVVDEFQDSNPNQIAIILELKRRNKNIKSLVVVGDELQAIYGFRNATPDNLVDFSNYFPQMVDIDMTANFRSQQPIIRLANQIISKVSVLGKVIEAYKKTSNVQPAVIEIDTAEQEQLLFARQTAKLIKDGVAPSNIAILCRTRAELIKQQILLSKMNIPAILKVPEVVADAPYVKSIIALASFLKDEKDMASLALYAKSVGEDPFDVVSLKASGEAIRAAFDACKTELDKVTAFFEFITGATEDYMAAAFVDKMQSFHFPFLIQYLDYCTKYQEYLVKDTKSTAQQETDCVTLITTHSAKGLEWDIVLLSLKQFPVDAESRRLFYVGVTRAKEKLLVTYTKKQQILADLLN